MSPRSGSVALQLYCPLWSYGSLQTVNLPNRPKSSDLVSSRSGQEMLVLLMSFMFMQASLQFCDGTYTNDEGKLEGKFHWD